MGSRVSQAPTGNPTPTPLHVGSQTGREPVAHSQVAPPQQYAEAANQITEENLMSRGSPLFSSSLDFVTQTQEFTGEQLGRVWVENQENQWVS